MKKILIGICYVLIMLLPSTIALPVENTTSDNVIEYDSVASSSSLPDIKAINIKTGWKIFPVEWYFGIMCIVKNVGNAPMKTMDKIRIEAEGELKDDEGNFIQYDEFYGEEYPELKPGESCGIYFTWDNIDLYTHPKGTIKFKCNVLTDFDEESSENNYFTKTFNHPEYQTWNHIWFGESFFIHPWFFEQFPIFQKVLLYLIK